MASKSGITYGAYGDLQAEQTELERRQRMIDALRQQANTPLETNQMAGGRVIPISPWQSLAKLAQTGASIYAQSKNDERMKDVAGKMTERRATMLRDAFELEDTPPPPQQPPSSGAGMPAPAADALGAPITPAVTAPVAGYETAPTPVAPAPAASKGGYTPEQRKIIARALKLEAINPELSAKMIENAITLTPEQKNMAAMGIDPLQAGKFKTDKDRIEATQAYEPGKTYVDPVTKKERTILKLGEGQVQAPDGTVSMAPGYQSSAAGLAAALRSAEEQARAGMDVVEQEVTDPTTGQLVPRRMTRAQQVQYVGGTPQQAPRPAPAAAPPLQPSAPTAGFPPGTQVPAPTAGTNPTDRMGILQQERAAMVASGARPAEMAMIDREIAALGKGRAPAAAATAPGPVAMVAPGVPVKSAVAKLREEKQAGVEADVYGKQLQADADARTASNKAYDDLMSAVPGVREALKTATGSGVGAVRDQVFNVFGKSTPASEAAAKLDVLGAKFIQSVPRFEGPQGVIDVQFYTRAGGNLSDRTKPNSERLAGLDAVVQMQRYNNAIVNGRPPPEPAWRNTPEYKAFLKERASAAASPMTPPTYPQQARPRPPANASPDEIVNFYMNQGR